jgi:Ino eighty subunit 2
MRRAEMARRRKNLSEKRNEEEKLDTINRLLNKQPAKVRGKPIPGGGETTVDGENVANGKDMPVRETMVRWVSTKDGIKIGVPSAWEEAPVGRVFVKDGLVLGGRGRRPVEEIS